MRIFPLSALISSAVAVLCFGFQARAVVPAPTHADVPYGKHPRQVIDFWQARADRPTPLVVFIHGGGFVAGDKSTWRKDARLAWLLGHGVSCAAVNYRFLPEAPVQDIMRDCGKAVQFLRSKAADWHLDKAKVAGVGGSAGAGTSLWLLSHEDMAKPDATDPIERESTRLCCAGLISTQATYDLRRWAEFLGEAKPTFTKGPNEVALFYHLPNAAALGTSDADKVLDDCDMLTLLSKDDGPLFIDNPNDVFPPRNRGEWLHCTAHARVLRKRCSELGLECVVVQDEKPTKPELTTFLAKHLGLK